MGAFTDSKGRDWIIDLTAEDIKHIRAAAAVDLLDEKQIAELSADPIKMVDTLAAALADQIKARDLDGRGFAIGLGEGALERGFDALLASLTSFFGCRGRLIAATYRKQVATMDAMEQYANQKLAQMDLTPQLRERLDRELDEALAKLGN